MTCIPSPSTHGRDAPALQLADRPVLPFTAIVDQPELQRALLLAAIDPAIGGVLISGPRGNAKSTAARALGALMPASPFVTLPLAASLEQLVGTLDIEGALRDGRVQLSPGLVARAHGGVLFVDEVNLLPDALVDALLDVAASGVNTVERDGISRQHAARFVLIGTMNPEEGALRPQLLDRFGLSLTLGNPRDPESRLRVLQARLRFDRDPQATLGQQASATHALQRRLAAARDAVDRLDWTEPVLRRAASQALSAGVDGVRADLVMLRAARALAAFDGRGEVTAHDVDAVAELALAHRRSTADTGPARHAPGSPSPPRTPPGGPRSDPAPTPAPSDDAMQAPTLRRMTRDAESKGTRDLRRSEGRPEGEIEPEADDVACQEGDWGALPAQPAGLTRVPAHQEWLPKKR